MDETKKFEPYRRLKKAAFEVSHSMDPNVAFIGSALLPLIFLGETAILPFDFIHHTVSTRLGYLK